jgi:RND family efflux transporter MFP subunit
MVSFNPLHRFYPVLLLGFAAAGCGPAEPPPAPPPPKVTVSHPIARELIDEEEFNGWMQATEEVEVRARVRGHIDKIHFQAGDIVTADQLLFELDPRPFQVQIDQATAQARALEAQKVAAEKDVARYSELLKSGGASKQQLEKAEADAAAYEAQIAAKNEEVKQYQLDLEYSQIKSPIAGRISRPMLTEGNLVNAGGSDPLLTTVVALDPVYVYFSVDERTVQRYQRSHPQEQTDKPITMRDRKVPFRFGLDSDDGFPHQGMLDFADNRIDSATGTVQIRGVVENKQGQFIPGSRVKIRVPVSDPYTAVLAPDSAILSDQDRRYLLVVDDKNVVARRDITPGKLLDDGMRVVLPAGSEKGLTTDERIIVLGLQRARLNYPVDPVEQSAAPNGAPSGEQVTRSE